MCEAQPFQSLLRRNGTEQIFKLVQGERVLLQSAGFDSPRDAGQRIASIKSGTLDADVADFMLGEGVSSDEVNAALEAFVAAALEGQKG